MAAIMEKQYIPCGSSSLTLISFCTKSYVSTIWLLFLTLSKAVTVFALRALSKNAWREGASPPRQRRFRTFQPTPASLRKRPVDAGHRRSGNDCGHPVARSERLPVCLPACRESVMKWTARYSTLHNPSGSSRRSHADQSQSDLRDFHLRPRRRGTHQM